MARRRVRDTEQWRQPVLPGLAEQLDGHRPADAGVASISLYSAASGSTGA